jgi:micrococcal nuclease
MRSSPCPPRRAPGLTISAALVAFVALAAVLAGCASGPGDPPAAGGPGATDGSGGPGAAVITRVIDGDTVVVDLGGRSERVRLVGVDTPEIHSPTKPVQCYGKEASAHTSELLAPGTAVRLERDADERDTYGRLLAYIYRSSDGLFVNLDLARGGFADALRIAPNVAHAEEIAVAVDGARAAGLGLWGKCGGPGRAL